MPIFQHGKNAFLAIGFENQYGPGRFASMTSTSVSGTAGTLVVANTLLANEGVLGIVNGTSYYGLFVTPDNNQYLSPLPSLTYPVFTTTVPTTSSTGVTFGNTIDSTISSVAGAGTVLPMINLSPYINDIGFPQDIEAAETTSFGAAGVKSYIVGLKGSTLTFSGHYDGSSTVFGSSGGLDELLYTCLQVYQAKAGNFVSFVYGPSDPGALMGGAASKKYFGQAILTKYDIKSAVNSVVTFDGELQVTGAVSHSII